MILQPPIRSGITEAKSHPRQGYMTGKYIILGEPLLVACLTLFQNIDSVK